MSGPPRLPKPPFSATLVVQASRELTWSEKGVWLRIWALDRDERGCYASAVTLGEDVGLGARAVEKLRASLLAAGILGSDGRRGRDGSAWFALLPGGAIPPRDRPSRDERQACVAFLDGHIRTCRADAENPNGRSELRGGKTPNSGSVIRKGETPNRRSELNGTDNPNNGSGLVAAGNPNDRTENPNACSGFLTEIPNNRSPEVITALPTEISVSDEVINTPTSGAPDAARRRGSGERSHERDSVASLASAGALAVAALQDQHDRGIA